MPSRAGIGLHRPIRAKLIFNANSGRPEDSPQQLASILSEMQEHNILPEVFTVLPDSRLEAVVQSAIKAGINLIVVAGGDGTIDSIVGAMVGSSATLGIIPTGTRNNLAFNLGISRDIAESVAILREGRRLRIDVGRVRSGRARHWFLEVMAIGLISDLYPMADEIQHGQLGQIGELLSTFISATPSRLRMILDGHQRLDASAHMMLVANMPFFGPHFQISPNVSFQDGRLDLFTFSDMTKLGMLSYAMLSQGGLVENVGIEHFRIREARIRSNPEMPVLADGVLLGKGSLSVRVYPHALMVMAGAELTGESSATPIINAGAALDG
ncbi:MAG: diacylglycerol kinase family protein [Anaerolineales bacterium]|jgi:YegS/Rv2252/BmrU family lipid kinase